MTLQKALKLRAGDKVRFWDGPADWKAMRDYFEGVVLFVTDRGGVKVRRNGQTEWVPYQRVECIL